MTSQPFVPFSPQTGQQPFLDTPWARSPAGDIQPSPAIRFVWATVASTGPIRIVLDGETSEIPVTPDTLVAESALATEDRVWVQQYGSRIIIIGRAGGLP